MNRYEADEYAVKLSMADLKGYTYPGLIKTIYDDFDNMICLNCTHSLDTYQDDDILDCTIGVSSYPESSWVDETFGCSKFERKQNEN